MTYVLNSLVHISQHLNKFYEYTRIFLFVQKVQ